MIADMNNNTQIGLLKGKITALAAGLFFLGIYIMPEKIKWFALVYMLVTTFFYLKSMKIVLLKGNTVMLWALYICIGIISTIINGVSINYSLNFILSIVIGIIVSCTYFDQNSRDLHVKAVYIVSCITVLGCILQIVAPEVLMKITSMTLGPQKYVLFKNFMSWGRIVGFSYQTGVTAHYLFIFELYIGAVLLLNKDIHKRRRIIYGMVFLVGFIFLLFTEKRSALLALLVVICVLFYLIYRKKALKIITGGIAIIVAAFCVFNFTSMGQKMIERTLGNNPFTGRLKIYDVLLEQFFEKPVLGGGLGSTLINVKDFFNGHNIYLQVLSETGICGLMVILFILIMNLIIAIKTVNVSIQKKDISVTEIFCLGYEIYFIVLGLMGNVLYDIFPLVLYMIVYVIILSIRKEQKEKSNYKLFNYKRAR